MDGVERRAIRNWKCPETAEEFKPLRACRYTFIRIRPDTGIINVARCKATNGNDKGSKAWFRPFSRIPIILMGRMSKGRKAIKVDGPLGMRVHAKMAEGSRMCTDSIAPS